LEVAGGRVGTQSGGVDPPLKMELGGLGALGGGLVKGKKKESIGPGGGEGKVWRPSMPNGSVFGTEGVGLGKRGGVGKILKRGKAKNGEEEQGNGEVGGGFKRPRPHRKSCHTRKMKKGYRLQIPRTRRCERTSRDALKGGTGPAGE